MSSVGDLTGWSSNIWDKIKEGVHNQTQHLKIGQKMLSLNPVQNVTNIPADKILPGKAGLQITEGDSTPLIETSVLFSMTRTQVQQEHVLSTAHTLATYAASLISGAQDQIIFQGSGVTPPNVIIETNGNKDTGLVNANSKSTIVVKPPAGAAKGDYGTETFSKVSQGIAVMQNTGHYGPYALVLRTEIYANTYTPLGGTLVVPAHSIRPLVEAGFYGSGNLPQNKGILLSLGGNTMDLTVGTDTTPEFMSYQNGMYNFRIFERFAFRLKNEKAVINLDFQ